ncbi:MAG TPA: adenylate/guanylate cyclase domain-containing protein, partial [Acidimicrobiia bacterium]|nr:adenylate/guanylate cyclase domain-containing protein [Acidimicrobiia bacterium]
LMVVFRHSALDAVACAVAMQEAIAALDADDPAQIYVGISAGEAAEDDNDWFGTPVNEAARLCAAAQPGQTLTNEVVRGLVGTRGRFEFRSIGPLTLKGLPGPVATVEVVSPPEPEPKAVREAVPERPAQHPAHGRNIALVAAAVVVVIAVPAAAIAIRNRGSSSQSSTARPAASLGSYPVSYSAVQCPADDERRIPGLICGTLTVPEDRSKPHGRVVRLGVYRAPARGHAASDPVLDFGADDLATSPARDHAEEIQLAQRGWSGPPLSDPALTCPEYTKVAPDALTKPFGDPAEQQREQAALQACYTRWQAAGVDLDSYNYVSVGDDMVDLIRALHFDHVNLVSGYVATIAALEVVRRLPDVVRTLTLQEPVAPGQSSYTNPTKYLSDAFGQYAALCRQDASCNVSFPNLPEQLRAAADFYRAHPHLVMGDDGNGHRHAIWLDATRTAQALRSALNHREVFPLIAAAIAATAHGGASDSPIAASAVADNADVLDPTFGWGAYLSNLCSYELYTIDVNGSALTRRTLPELAGIDDGFLQQSCKVWQVHEIADVAFDDPSTTVPTLIVAPAFEPAADPQWSDTFQRGLPNATALVFGTLDGNVLGVSNPPCLAQLRRAFLADPAKPIDAAQCERLSPPIRFLTSLTG